MRELYQAKGYSEEWIEKRVRGIAIRDELTNEWKKRGVKEQRGIRHSDRRDQPGHLRHDTIRNTRSSRGWKRRATTCATT